MRRLLFIIIALFITQSTLAQESIDFDNDDLEYLKKNYFTHSVESVVAVSGNLRNILLSCGPWIPVFDEYLNPSGKMIFSPDGTGTWTYFITEDREYRNIKKMQSKKVYPFTWKTDGANLRIDFHKNRMTWTNGNQSQLAKLSAAEKQDWQKFLNNVQQRTRLGSLYPFNSRIVRADRDFIVSEFVSCDFVAFVSQSGLQKILNPLRQRIERKKQQANNRKKELFYSSCPDENHPHSIDLGLSVNWACCHVGASSPIGFGEDFMWGETDSSKEDYTYQVAGEYLDIGKNIAGTKYDVAHVKWGGEWRMPVREDFKELLKYCRFQWVDESDFDIKGAKFIGPNGNSIFFRCEDYGDIGGEGVHCWCADLKNSGKNSGEPHYFSVWRNFSYNYETLISNNEEEIGYRRLMDMSIRPVMPSYHPVRRTSNME